jgi:hypothetical protein
MDSTSLGERVLAHRGLWSDKADANSPGALLAALEAGFGIETDLRDLDGQIVVSHDPPSRTCPRADPLIEDWTNKGLLGRLPLALNIKSDGLLTMLGRLTPLIELTPHFFFDMSFPQLLTYVRVGLPVALRISEFEPPAVHLLDLLEIKPRYWLDGFDSDWWLQNPHIAEICHSSPVTVVSPEIHGREPGRVWEWFAARVDEGCNISICTDRPFQVLEGCS